MAILLIERSDGGVTILNTESGTDAAAEVAKWEESWALFSGGGFAVSTTEILDKDIPTDRWFRDAWVQTGGVISVDIPKARIIQAKRINAARTDAVTVLQRRADEATLEGRAADAIRAANDKVAVEGLNLATIATQIAGAANPTALLAIWPAELQEFRP